jgi:hypothetical protein
MPVVDNDEPISVGEDWPLARFALRRNAIGTSRQRQLPIEIALTGK